MCKRDKPLVLCHCRGSSLPSNKGECCNLSVAVALNVRFTTNGKYAKNNTYICAMNKQQQSDPDRVIFIFACCHSVKLCALAARAFQPQQQPVTDWIVMLDLLFSVDEQCEGVCL